MCDPDNFLGIVELWEVRPSNPEVDGVPSATVELKTQDGGIETRPMRVRIADESTGIVELTLEDLVLIDQDNDVDQDEGTVTPGQRIDYTILVENNGNASATNVTVVETLPADTTFIWSDGGVFDGTTVTWAGLTIEPGETKKLRFAVELDRGTAALTLDNDTYTVVSDQTVEATGVADSLTVNAEAVALALTKESVVEQTADNRLYKWVSPAYCGSFPVVVTINYVAGSPDHNLEEEIALISVARLANAFCECGCDKGFIETMRSDWAMIDSKEYRRISVSDLSNPFGTRGGEVTAWRRVSGYLDTISYATTF
jgi:uncharacterized repeat protein (TIGR01451 family)